MPTYTYFCKQCNDRFDVVQMMSDDPISHCPKCLGAVKRLIGQNVGIQFVGSGFYSNDSKNQAQN